MILLRLFGGGQVEIDGVPVGGPAGQRRRVALLALLAARDPRMSRDRVIGYLWPETSGERARHLLSESLYVLRKALGEQIISTTGEYLQLNRDAFRCDLWEFEEALQARDLETAIGIYAGPFLEGVYLDNAGEFEQWVELERSRLETSYRRALEALSDSLLAEGQNLRALDVLRKLAALDPHTGRIALKLMRAYEATGDRAAAIQHARLHTLLLQDDLGAELEPEIAEYVERLRKAPPATQSAPTPESTPGDGPLSPEVALEPQVPTATAVDASASAAGARARPDWVRWIAPLRARSRSAGVLVTLLLLVLLASVLRRELPPADVAADPATSAIAVLPFAAGTGGELVPEHVRDGITEEIIHSVSQVQGIRVTSSTSSFLFRSRGELGVREIGERLGVDVVLEGSVVRRGEGINIRIQLVDVRSGFNIWSRQFDRDLEEVSTFPAEIARTIAGTLGGTLLPDAYLGGLERWSADRTALELYWLGRSHWNRRTPEGFRQAMQAFNDAIARDRRFALAYAGLADVSAQALWSGEDPSRAYASARALAEEALRLEPRLAEPHATLGVVHLYSDRDWDAAEREFRRALELNPSYATAYHWYGALLGLKGETAVALEMLQRAEELDPISAAIRTSVGTVLYYAGRYPEAREQYRRALEIEPRFWPAWAQRACASLMEGRYEEALADARHALTLSEGSAVALAVLAIASAHAGRRDDARRMLRDLAVAAAEGRYVSPTLRAGGHAALGENEAALQLLEQALRDNDELLVVVPVEPLFTALRSEPSFARVSHSARQPRNSQDPRPAGR